ncbi:MAG: hypothetical protein O2955_04800 [Planctomycetota bacterium]|nr:hypothetical protein [Planctomycetota bacterium]MDA1211810.1 hypothetical protein [Planctomycetota bacterium]
MKPYDALYVLIKVVFLCFAVISFGDVVANGWDILKKVYQGYYPSDYLIDAPGPLSHLVRSVLYLILSLFAVLKTRLCIRLIAPECEKSAEITQV